MEQNFKFKRDDYGEIVFSSFFKKDNSENYLRDLQAEAFCLVADAAKKKKIPRSFNLIERDWKKGTFDGSATAHEIYDVSEDGRHCLVCVRDSEGSKYCLLYTSPSPRD